MSDDTTSPDLLLDLLHSMDEESKPNALEPGVFLRVSPWMRGAKFKAYTRDSAGCEAWERAYARDVTEYQRSIAPAPIVTAAPAADNADISSRPIIRIIR